jgi:hypothetical protein
MNPKDCACGHGKSSHSYGYYQCYHEDCGCMKFTKQEPFPNKNWTGKMADAEDKCDSVNVNSEASELRAAIKRSGMRPVRFSTELFVIPTERKEGIDTYDAGILGGDQSWHVYRWHDYLRSELERAHEFYAAIIEEERHQRDVYQKAAAIASNYIADDDTFPSTIWLACGRKVKVECAQPMLEGPQPYLTVETEMHPSFEGKQ